MKVNVNVDIWPVTIKYKFPVRLKVEFVTTYVHTYILPSSFVFGKIAFVPKISGMTQDLVAVTNQIY